MDKEIIKSDGKLGIIFDDDEIEYFNLHKGDFIDIGDIVKIKTQKGGSKK